VGCGAREVHAREVHTPVRCTPVISTPVRCTPARCRPVRYTDARCRPVISTPARCTPVRYTDAKCTPVRCKVHGREVQAREVHAWGLHTSNYLLSESPRFESHATQSKISQK
jgi:hypothetical protein